MATISASFDTPVGSSNHLTEAVPNELCLQPSAMPKPLPFPFEKLPLELRHDVYHCVVADENTDRIIKVALNDDTFRSESLKNIAGAILVNKAMSGEIRDYIFRTFAFSLSDIAPSGYSLVQKFCDRIGKKNVQLVKDIIIPHMYAHDVNARVWGNYEEYDSESYGWGSAFKRHVSNRLLELQSRKVLNRMPSLQRIQVGVDLTYMYGILVGPCISQEELERGPSYQIFSMPMNNYSLGQFGTSLVLQWLLATLHSRNISLDIYWADVRKKTKIMVDEEWTEVDEEYELYAKRAIVNSMSSVLLSTGNAKAQGHVTDMGILPDDLFAYAIPNSYFKSPRARRTHLYQCRKRTRWAESLDNEDEN